MVKIELLEFPQGYTSADFQKSYVDVSFVFATMKPDNNFYKLYSKYGLEGYYIPVRNSFSNTIEREFIPLKAKEIFEKKFSGRLITDTEFMSWYTENSVNFE